MDDWPFSDVPNVAVFTVHEVFAGTPILLVHHDVDDGGWQFLTGKPVEMADAMLVTLKSIVKLDPTISELAGLPIGWMAERKSIRDPWTQRPNDG